MSAIGEGAPRHFVRAADSKLNVDVAAMDFEFCSIMTATGQSIDHDVHPIAIDLVPPGTQFIEIRRAEILERCSKTWMNCGILVGMGKLIKNHYGALNREGTWDETSS